MRSIVLIANPGFRDPFYQPIGHKVPQPHPYGEVRSSSPPEAHSANHAWMHQVLTDKALQTSCCEGPIGRAIRQFSQNGDSVKKLVLLFAPDAGRMSDRVGICQKHFSCILPQEATIELLPLDTLDVSDYQSAYNCISQEVLKLPEVQTDHVALLLGPGTPQMNMALALLAAGDLYRAELYQAVHPIDGKPKAATVAFEAIRLIEIGKRRMPAIALSGRETPKERRLLDEIEELKIALAQQQEAIAAAPGALESAAAEGAIDLDAMLESQARVLVTRFIAQERSSAFAEGRAPAKAKVAERLCMSRQKFDYRLKELNLTF